VRADLGGRGRRRAARAVLAAAGLLVGAAVLAAPPADAAARQPLATVPSDWFGDAVAISGATAVIGADGVNKGAGAAYVFIRSGTTWRRQAALANPGGAEGDGFGSSAAVSSTAAGTTAVIGAPATADDAGMAYVYTRSGKAWHLQAALASPDGGLYDNFGDSVAVSGTTAVIGAYGVHKTRGAAYVFARSGNTWRLQAALYDPSGHLSDNFGWSVAVSGTTAVIGDPGRDLAVGGGGAGAAFVYVRSGTAWRRQASFYDPEAQGADGFGMSVAISGATAVISDPGASHSQGAAYVYQRSGTAWHRVAKLTSPHPVDYGGFAGPVAVSGTRVLIGEPLTALKICGTAYEFIRSGRTWRERARVANPDPSCATGAADDFGWSVALSGRTAVIGAPGKPAAYEQTLP
jgi:FG-GAP repeat